MQSVLIVIHLMVIVMLVAVVLLQRSEGGALGLGGGGGFLTGRGQANALTRATAILAALFFVTSLGLSILARFGQGPEVTFQSLTPVEPTSGGAGKEAERKGSLLDQLKQMEGAPAEPPALPPGVSAPESSMPAESEEEEEAPQETHSIMQTAPPNPIGLPAPKQPPTPLATLPAHPGPGARAPTAAQPEPGPFKPQAPAAQPMTK
jgi:preprotein translocase subunit SecG